jgi:hypothetical protein
MCNGTTSGVVDQENVPGLAHHLDRERIQAARQIGADGVVLRARKAEQHLQAGSGENGGRIEFSGVQHVQTVPFADHLRP